MGFDMKNDTLNKEKAPTCGATTRTGAPCKNKRLHRGGRCRNHGGLSTGPVTPDGKLKSLANLKNHKTL